MLDISAQPSINRLQILDYAFKNTSLSNISLFDPYRYLTDFDCDAFIGDCVFDTRSRWAINNLEATDNGSWSTKYITKLDLVTPVQFLNKFDLELATNIVLIDDNTVLNTDAFSKAFNLNTIEAHVSSKHKAYLGLYMFKDILPTSFENCTKLDTLMVQSSIKLDAALYNFKENCLLFDKHLIFGANKSVPANLDITSIGDYAFLNRTFENNIPNLPTTLKILGSEIFRGVTITTK
jgi:hypothetical protein